jgi:hypothetical protein
MVFLLLIFIKKIKSELIWNSSKSQNLINSMNLGMITVLCTGVASMEIIKSQNTRVWGIYF